MPEPDLVSVGPGISRTTSSIGMAGSASTAAAKSLVRIGDLNRHLHHPESGSDQHRAACARAGDRNPRQFPIPGRFGLPPQRRKDADTQFRVALARRHRPNRPPGQRRCLISIPANSNWAAAGPDICVQADRMLPLMTGWIAPITSVL